MNFDQPLEKLIDLLSPLLGTPDFSFSVYDENNQLLLSRGSLPGPDQLQVSGPIAPGKSGVLVLDDVRLGWTCNPASTRTFTLAIATPPSHVLDTITLASLLKIGAALLAQGTELSSLNKFLKQSIKEREAVSSLIEDGLLVLDRSGFLKYINGAGRNILHLEDSHKAFHELLGFEPIISDVFSRRRGYVDRHVTITRRGVDIHLLDTAIPITGGYGEIVSVVNIFRRSPQNRTTSGHILSTQPVVRIGDFIGLCSTTQKIKHLALTVSHSRSRLLISGEPGTGKTTIAHRVHSESDSADKALLTIRCDRFSMKKLEEVLLVPTASVPEVGAWKLHDDFLDTSRIGSLFFEHLDATPIPLQRQLLSALEHYQTTVWAATVHTDQPPVRFMASTSTDIAVVIREQSLYPGLHAFFSEFSISLPPLRKRGGDITLLAQAFYTARQHGKNFQAIC